MCVRACMYRHKYTKVYAQVCVCMFVLMLVTVFAVTFCAYIISFDGNLVFFVVFTHYCLKGGGADSATCPSAWTGIWSFALPLWTCISFFLCIRVNLALCQCKNKWLLLAPNKENAFLLNTG